MSAEMPKIPEPTDAQIISWAYDCNALPEFCTDESLKQFARMLWQEAARQAMERCAEVCESRITGGIPLTRASNDFDCEAMACANAIRALVNK